MSTYTGQRIAALDEIVRALSLLSTHGYATGPLWDEHKAWLAAHEQRTPSADDAIWATRAKSPSGIDEHLEGGQPKVLSAADVWAGRQYTLTAGQRDILRERYGLTPTLVVVAENVGTFGPDSNVIDTITLRSVEHVDPRRRTKVLNAVVLRPAWQFFRDAAAKDKAREDAEVEADKERVAKGARPVAKRSIALEYV